MTATSVSREGPGNGALGEWGLPGVLCLAGVLLSEYLLVSFLFDVAQLSEHTGWLGALGHLGVIGPLALAIATATFLLGGDDLRAEFGSVDVPEQRGSRVWSFGVAHAACYAGFLTLTHWLVSAPSDNPISAGLLVVSWAAVGLASVLLLVNIAVPLQALLALSRRAARALGVGVGVGLVAWWAGLATEGLWKPLSTATLHTSAWMLRLVTPDVLTDASEALVGTKTFSVTISPVCSGYEGMGLILVFLGAYLWIFRKSLRFPQVLVLLPLAVLVVWVVNSFRIAALIAVGSWVSAEIALGGFHSKAGWLLFCAIALGMVGLIQRSSVFRIPTSEDSSPGEIWNPTAAYLMPLLALIATSMVTGLFSKGFNALYPLGVLAGAAMLLAYRRYYGPIRWSWSWTAAGIGGLVFVLWIALEPTAEPSGMDEWSRGARALPKAVLALWLLFRVVGSVVLVPIVEELAFRGYLLRRLVSADFTGVASGRFAFFPFLVSSLAFGILHQRWLAGTLAGVLFAVAQYRRGRLGDAIIAHAVANGLIAVFVVGGSRWSLWM